ncbi:MAG TPA: hypothetical protein VIX83_01030 [Candidatus Cybelea sp.]
MDSVAARRAGEIFEAMLLAPVLRPLGANAGPLGDYELDLMANEIARCDRGGFATLVAAGLEGRR